jgi:hypothetical protein
LHTGETFIVNATTVTTQDNIILINSGEVGAGVTSLLSGLQVDRGSLTDYQIVFDEIDDMFKVGQIGQLETIASHNWVSAGFATAAQGILAENALPFSNYTATDILAKIKTVDGVGSGLDADLLDGLSSESFATAAQGILATNALPAASYTAADVLTKIKTVDGVGSGLDADLLGGQSSAYYQVALGFTPENVVNKNALNGYAGLDATGKISSSQLPTTASSDNSVVDKFAALSGTTYNYNNSNLVNVLYSTGNKMVINYTGNDISSVVYYETDGTTILATNSFIYSNGLLTSNTWS